MDLGLDEQQELLKNSARDFLEKECPEKLVRDMEEDEKGYSPELWKKMARAGLAWASSSPRSTAAPVWTSCDLIVLLEEFGRALVPGPFISTVVLGGVPIDGRRHRPAEELGPAQDRVRRADHDAGADRAVGAIGRRTACSSKRRRTATATC